MPICTGSIFIEIIAANTVHSIENSTRYSLSKLSLSTTDLCSSAQTRYSYPTKLYSRELSLNTYRLLQAVTVVSTCELQ